MAPKRKASSTKKAIIADAPPKKSLSPPLEEEDTSAPTNKRKREAVPSKAKGKGKNKNKKGVQQEEEEEAEAELGLDLKETKKEDKNASKTVTFALEPSNNPKIIIIEASKECNAFKTRAAKVEAVLKEAVPGVTVKINPEKPRRGCFEIRSEEGTMFISCLNMPRPFKKMKDLDLDKEIEVIIGKIQ